MCGCVWGLIPKEAGIWKHQRSFYGGHHQFMENAQLLIALAFAFDYCALPPPLLVLAAVLLAVGTWTNPLAYVIVSITDTSNEIFKGGLSDEGVKHASGPSSPYSFWLLMTCAVTILGGLSLMLVGVARHCAGSETAPGLADEFEARARKNQ
eukprot:tig00000523_g1847.t1